MMIVWRYFSFFQEKMCPLINNYPQPFETLWIKIKKQAPGCPGACCVIGFTYLPADHGSP